MAGLCEKLCKKCVRNRLTYGIMGKYVFIRKDDTDMGTNYIVLDLEWNQAMSAKSEVFYHLPIHLRGEIIQIGAVKLNEDFTPGEEFQIDVKPVYFRRMHYKVKKLTGIDSSRLAGADGFKEAMRKFQDWCGGNATFITWGYDDRGIMEQNIIVHDLDWDWIDDWINLQLIYNLQTDGDRNQKALHTAMEHFEIEQTRVAHDALGDAYNTALVCSRLDFVQGLTQYAHAQELLAAHKAQQTRANPDEPEAAARCVFSDYPSRAEAFADPQVTATPCPVCGEPLSGGKWVNQGDRRYMNLCTCPDHGKYLVRIRFHKLVDETWAANRIVYVADEELERGYREKLIQSRKRGRRHGRSKKKDN